MSKIGFWHDLDYVTEEIEYEKGTMLKYNEMFYGDNQYLIQTTSKYYRGCLTIFDNGTTTIYIDTNPNMLYEYGYNFPYPSATKYSNTDEFLISNYGNNISVENMDDYIKLMSILKDTIEIMTNLKNESVPLVKFKEIG